MVKGLIRSREIIEKTIAPATSYKTRSYNIDNVEAIVLRRVGVGFSWRQRSLEDILTCSRCAEEAGGGISLGSGGVG
jgi:hypothetical protein